METTNDCPRPQNDVLLTSRTTAGAIWQLANSWTGQTAGGESEHRSWNGLMAVIGPRWQISIFFIEFGWPQRKWLRRLMSPPSLTRVKVKVRIWWRPYHVTIHFVTRFAVYGSSAILQCSNYRSKHSAAVVSDLRTSAVSYFGRAVLHIFRDVSKQTNMWTIQEPDGSVNKPNISHYPSPTPRVLTL